MNYTEKLKSFEHYLESEDKELTRDEFRRLISAAEDSRISAVIQTICGTGIRVRNPSKRAEIYNGGICQKQQSGGKLQK